MGGKPSKILDGLYQGGGDVLQDEKFFVDNKISHVVSVCPDTPDLGDEHVLKSIHIDIDDIPSAQLVPHFANCINFIHKARIDGNVVYVHCAAGISRSSTITIAYLMTIFDCSYTEALHFLQNQRSCACPNEGFEAQLLGFERDQTNSGKTQIMKDLFSKFKAVPSDKQFNLKGATMTAPDCTNCKAETKAQVMCKECGFQTLCNQCDEMLHSAAAAKQHNRTALMSEEGRKRFKERLNAKRNEAHLDYLESKRRDASRVNAESDDDDEDSQAQVQTATSLSSSFSPKVGPFKSVLRDRKDAGWETEADEEEDNFANDSRADEYEVYHEGSNHRDSVTSVPEDTDIEENNMQHSNASSVTSAVASPASSISEKKDVQPKTSDEVLASEAVQAVPGHNDDDILKAVLPGYEPSKKGTKTDFEKYCR